MTLPLQPRRYTLEEYFELERSAEEKYEYRNGEVVNLSEIISMSGGSFRHVRITTNLTTSLNNRLKDGPYQSFGPDLRIRVPRKTLWTYPDATVICGDPQIESLAGIGDTALNPQVIVEVLSPSTEAFDRGKKFEWYREVESLREYVLVSQHAASVEVFARNPNGAWAFAPVHGLNASASLRSLQIQLPLSEIYAGVDLSQEA
jgi:Uma2 family endonuclease